MYHGANEPSRYAGQTGCGVVIAWTHHPVTMERTPLTSRRVVAAASLGLLAFLGTR